MQSQKVVPDALSPSASSKKYRLSDEDRTESSTMLKRNDSFSAVGTSEEAIYAQLSDVYLDPTWLRYADAGAEKAIKEGQTPAINPWVKKMEQSFAMNHARR
jgi:hypothetical protein